MENVRIAERNGIQLLAIHGRTKACMYKGKAEYDTIKKVKQSIRIPVVANGDITSPEKAKMVIDYTGADGVMVGRGAQGNPWIFKTISHYLVTGERLPSPTLSEVKKVLITHLRDIHQF